MSGRLMLIIGRKAMFGVTVVVLTFDNKLFIVTPNRHKLGTAVCVELSVAEVELAQDMLCNCPIIYVPKPKFGIKVIEP